MFKTKVFYYGVYSAHYGSCAEWFLSTCNTCALHGEEPYGSAARSEHVKRDCAEKSRTAEFN